MTIRYGECPLKMAYDDNELNSIIEDYIKNCKNDGRYYFSYKELCNSVFIDAQTKNKLIKDEGVEYNSPVMTNGDATRMSRLLWKHIWAQQIFIDFHDNKYAVRYPGDTYFGIL